MKRKGTIIAHFYNYKKHVSTLTLYGWACLTINRNPHYPSHSWYTLHMHDPLPSSFSLLKPPTLEFTKTQHEDHTTFASFLPDLNFYITLRQLLLSLILHPLLFALRITRYIGTRIAGIGERTKNHRHERGRWSTRTCLCRVTAESYTYTYIS